MTIFRRTLLLLSVATLLALEGDEIYQSFRHGIKGEQHHCTNVYFVSTIDELKEINNEKKGFNKKSKREEHFKKRKLSICFNSGQQGHISIEWQDKLKGHNCFHCDSFGHIVTDCLKNGNSKGNPSNNWPMFN